VTGVQQAKVAFPMQTGLNAPTFKLEDPKNTRFHSIFEVNVLLTFWATWCVPCQKGSACSKHTDT